ncbi:RluA family pseudouridine synthase [Oceanospirillum maris]|uniref:RluA family pseudouridine synthase n=1 Tax=Oceanospirillum maris TaxID=64977 RepID=UPI00041829D0|nr:RluA family pseudouridine synthase [Oceanospirillum maris]
MAEAAHSVRFVTIDSHHEGQRVDNFLITFLKGVPKNLVYRIIRKGEVRVNKKRVKAVYRLQTDDVVRVPPVRMAEKAEDMPVSKALARVLEAAVLKETDDWIVMNKPQGLAVHAGSGIQGGLIESFRQIRPEGCYLELVHRLDKDTSGCLLLAKNRKALNFLQEQLKAKAFRKTYHALTVGRWPQAVTEIDAPLKKHDIGGRERVVKVDRKEGKASLTRFNILKRYDAKGVFCTLVEAEPVTGRTHQIRVHAQSIGHSLIGDVKYGDEKVDRHFKSLGFKRLFLHAASLGFPDPATGAYTVVEAPYEASLQRILDQLSAV